MGDATNPPHYLGTHMTSTLHIPLYGHKPHSRKLEFIREEYVRWHRVSKDMERLEDDTGRGMQIQYEKLQMKRADVKKYIVQQKDRE